MYDHLEKVLNAFWHEKHNALYCDLGKVWPFLQYFDYEPERRKDVVRGFPNTIVSYPISSISIPVWFAEGVAQRQVQDARFDYRDPNREMIIRDRIIHDQLLSYPEMGVFGKNSHGNESAYNLGFSFVGCNFVDFNCVFKFTFSHITWSN